VKDKITLRHYQEFVLCILDLTSRKPKRIISYGDEVNEGKFYQVLIYEIDAIRTYM